MIGEAVPEGYEVQCAIEAEFCFPSGAINLAVGVYGVGVEGQNEGVFGAVG